MALAVCPAALAGPRLLVGAAEDAPQQPDLVGAVTKMRLARLTGLDAIRLTAQWTPGRWRPRVLQLTMLQNATDAAALNGLDVFLAVYSPGSRTTPRTRRLRSQFASYTAALARGLPTVRRFIIGNEPNLNRFWMPQFRKRKSASPASYVSLLAKTYDALKRVSPRIQVIGGALAPRGGDDPREKRQTHSPTRFILEMGKAYRRMHRKRPIMDGFSIHPYPANSRQSPTFRHPRSTTITMGDYGKLTKLLRRAFRGTRQPGAQLPIVYAEFGVQSRIPPDKADVYTNADQPVSADAVSEALQARYYREAVKLAYCQRTVTALLIFHVSDEQDLRRWQSGVYYADDTPKSSLPALRQAAEDVRDRRIARCWSR
jgi:hypothetical protein